LPPSPDLSNGIVTKGDDLKPEDRLKLSRLVELTLKRRHAFLSTAFDELYQVWSCEGTKPENFKWIDFDDFVKLIVRVDYQPPTDPTDFLVHVRGVVNLIEGILEMNANPEHTIEKLDFVFRIADVAAYMVGYMPSIYHMHKVIANDVSRLVSANERTSPEGKRYFIFTEDYVDGKNVDLKSAMLWTLAGLIQRKYSLKYPDEKVSQRTIRRALETIKNRS
jgi:hypothetical protein